MAGWLEFNGYQWVCHQGHGDAACSQITLGDLVIMVWQSCVIQYTEEYAEQMSKHDKYKKREIFNDHYLILYTTWLSITLHHVWYKWKYGT